MQFGTAWQSQKLYSRLHHERKLGAVRALQSCKATQGNSFRHSKTTSSSMTGDVSTTRFLFAFDFDHTIMDGNTDTFIIKAHPNGCLPQELKHSYETGRWTEYMQRVLAHLHEQGVAAVDMQQALQQLPYTRGMEELLRQLEGGSIAGHPCHCIILSDSNSEFIEWILTSRGHRGVFSHVYTNPALVSSQGQVLVSPPHSHPCKACPVNMCKRVILQQHLQALNDSAGVQPVRVVYIGDGGNDLCPAQSLGPDEFVMVRAGYALDKMLQDPAVHATIKARVHRWSNASDILDALNCCL